MFKLMSLPYSVDALEPYMSKETLDFHYLKHHQAYVNFVNQFLDTNVQFQDYSLTELIIYAYQDKSLTALFNNAAQIYNHNIFWNVMLKRDKSTPLPSNIQSFINASFHSLDHFKEEFIKQGKSLFGSGWIFLVLHQGKLEIRSYSNGHNPVYEKIPVLIACDVWEHSYYIDYRNDRPKYLHHFINDLLNWEYVEETLVKLI